MCPKLDEARRSSISSSQRRGLAHAHGLDLLQSAADDLRPVDARLDDLRDALCLLSLAGGRIDPHVSRVVLRGSS